MRFTRIAATVTSTVAAAVTAAMALVAPVASAQGVGGQMMSSDNTMGMLEQQGCKPHYLIAVPGGANTVAGVPTFVPHGGHVFSTGLLTQMRTNGAIEPLWISYNSGAFAQRPYYAASKAAYDTTYGTVAKLANACPDATFSFTGFSLGADVTARLTRDIANGHGPIAQERVDAVAVIANPYQGPNGATLSPGTSPDSVGALGTLEGGYGVLAGRVLEICRPDDIVCSMREEHRALVAPAMRTHMSAGRVPWNEYQAILQKLGPSAGAVVAGMAAHGGYATFGPQQASDWIVQHTM